MFLIFQKVYKAVNIIDMPTGITQNGKGYKLIFRNEYIGTFRTREEAEAKKKELQSLTPKKSGGKREGAGRKKKEG